MAKRITAPRPGTKQPEWQTEICDTCRFSEWITDDHRHRDFEREPDLFTLPALSILHCPGSSGVC